MKMRLTLPAVLLLEHPGRQLPEERDERSRRGGDWFISRSLVLRQILQQIRVHHQWTSVHRRVQYIPRGKRGRERERESINRFNKK